jgi:hypothetical protein
MQIDESGRQRVRDEEHVKLLGIFYYVSAGMTAVFGLFPLIYVVMGVFVASFPGPARAEELAAARGMGIFFVAFGIGWFLMQQGFAAVKAYAGYCLRRRQKRILCIVVGGITCLGFPFSTVLGVFTFIVLLRDSVRDIFVDESNSKAIEATTT